MNELELKQYCLEQAIKFITQKGCLGDMRNNDPVELAKKFYDYVKGEIKENK